MESKLECEFDLESIEITENSNNNDLVSLINLICSEDTVFIEKNLEFKFE